MKSKGKGKKKMKLLKPEEPYKFTTIKKPVKTTDYAAWIATRRNYLRASNGYEVFLKIDLTGTTEEVNNKTFTDDTGGPETSRLGVYLI